MTGNQARKRSAQANLHPMASEVLLIAIARARSWMNDLSEGRVNSFEIARSENKVERHIRRLMPLAFVSPRIVKAIANGSAPADLTVTTLTSALSRSWTKQEKRYGIVCPIARRGHEMTCTSGHVALVIVVLEL